MSEVLSDMIDCEECLQSILSDVDIDVDIMEDIQHTPPMYNFMRSFQHILQSNIHNAVQETTMRKSTIKLNEYSNKIHKVISTYETECPICLEKIEKDTLCAKLPCLHTYHERCIKKWLTTKDASCPICRTCI